MRSSFFGLETMLRALRAQQAALDTVNHNIANANTEGYSRQDVVMEATTPWTVPGMNRPAVVGQIGTGVMATVIRRSRDVFADAELRVQNHTQSYWDQIATGMAQIEGVLIEPTAHGIGDALSRYFQAWQELSNNPESTAIRVVVREQAISLAGVLTSAFNQLTSLQANLDRQLLSFVPELNDIIDNIASLNDEIVRTEAPAQPIPGVPNVSANDLRDRRDLLLDKLVELTGATYSEDNRGVMTVRVGGKTIVADNFKLRILDPNDPKLDSATRSAILTASTVSVFTDEGTKQMTKLLWEDASPTVLTDNPEVTFAGGRLLGLVETRGVITPDAGVSPPFKIPGRIETALEALNKLARAIATETNTLHSAGFGLDDAVLPVPPRNFWTVPAGGTSAIHAGNLTVDAAIMNATTGPRAIAAAQSAGTTNPGDNRNALAIAQLLQQAVASLSGASMNDYYASIVGQQGADTRHAETMRDNQQLLTEHLQRRRESIQGVSLDEEAAKLIQFQRAYQAAARGITTLDDLLDTIINRMGVVGR